MKTIELKFTKKDNIYRMVKSHDKITNQANQIMSWHDSKVDKPDRIII